MPNRKLFIGVATIAMVVTASACSSSSKSSGAASPPPSSGTAAPHAAGTPIKVGVMCTCSGGGGFGAILAPGEQVYKAWAKYTNAAGGIEGHPVQLITEDDAGNPGTAASDIQTLLSDHVIAVADISLVDQTFASTLQQANVPVVGALSFEEPFGVNPDFYPEGQTTDSSAYAIIATAKAAGATNFGDIYCAESAACAQIVPGLKSAGTQLGVPFVYSASISATAPNYTAQCLAAKQKNVTAVNIGEAAPLVIRVATDCAQQNYKPMYVTEGAGYAANETSAPGLEDNSWFEFQSFPFFANTPAVQTARAAIDKYYPGLVENPSGFVAENFFSWPSGLLLEDALKAGGLTSSGTPTAALVVKGLESLHGDTLDGLAPPLTFTAGQPHKVDCWFTVRVQNSAASLQKNGKATCENGATS